MVSCGFPILSLYVIMRYDVMHIVIFIEMTFNQEYSDGMNVIQKHFYHCIAELTVVTSTNMTTRQENILSPSPHHYLVQQDSPFGINVNVVTVFIQ